MGEMRERVTRLAETDRWSKKPGWIPSGEKVNPPQNHHGANFPKWQEPKRMVEEDWGEIPSISIEGAGAVLQRLCQVSGGNLCSTREISDRARQFEDAVVRPGSELQLVHCRFH